VGIWSFKFFLLRWSAFEGGQGAGHAGHEVSRCRIGRPVTRSSHKLSSLIDSTFGSSDPAPLLVVKNLA